MQSASLQAPQNPRTLPSRRAGQTSPPPRLHRHRGAAAGQASRGWLAAGCCTGQLCRPQALPQAVPSRAGGPPNPVCQQCPASEPSTSRRRPPRLHQGVAAGADRAPQAALLPASRRRCRRRCERGRLTEPQSQLVGRHAPLAAAGKRPHLPRQALACRAERSRCFARWNGWARSSPPAKCRADWRGCRRAPTTAAATAGLVWPAAWAPLQGCPHLSRPC